MCLQWCRRLIKLKQSPHVLHCCSCESGTQWAGATFAQHEKSGSSSRKFSVRVPSLAAMLLVLPGLFLEPPSHMGLA